ncbi:MAG: hypothetical protein GXP62_00200 [Oligoflexia bacterium]|nr:hypothetical protein [Oligoflexia bacterium]
MDATHLHLLVNHLPILGSFFAVPLLVLALWKRQDPWVFAAAALLLFIGGAGAIVADQTGDGAKERVEQLPGVTKALIHEHEERADVAVPLSVVTGLAGLVVFGWSLKRRQVHLAAGGAVLVLAIATSAVTAWTGLAGGLIRHTEIRDGASASTAVVGGAGAGYADDDDDDD